MRYSGTVSTTANRIGSEIMSHIAEFIRMDISQTNFDKAEKECLRILKKELWQMEKQGIKFQEVPRYVNHNNRGYLNIEGENND